MLEKMMPMKGNNRNFLYFLSLTPAIAVIFGNLTGGYFSLANFVYSLVFLAVLEWITPPLVSNKHTPKSDLIPRIILYCHIPSQIVCLWSLFYGIHQGILTDVWVFAAALSTGINSGSSAIIISHELIHRKSATDRWFGKFLLFTAGNIYFYIEHLRIHHKWVGTQRDPATARYGETLYGFFIRSSSEQIRGAFQLEHQRLKSQRSGAFSGNYVVNQLILQTFWIVCLALTGGIWLVVAWLFQCLVANFLLEYVNYIQHYGLTRSEKERPTEEHSWESNQFVSRFILVDLSRHSDHHFHASKPYHTLIQYQNAHKLPSGYAGLFFIAAVPVFWKSLIHPRLANV